MPNQNGGTTEYANIISGIEGVDAKISEQQTLLQSEFSNKIDGDDIAPVAGATAAVASGYYAITNFTPAAGVPPWIAFDPGGALFNAINTAKTSLSANISALGNVGNLRFANVGTFARGGLQALTKFGSAIGAIITPLVASVGAIAVAVYLAVEAFSALSSRISDVNDRVTILDSDHNNLKSHVNQRVNPALSRLETKTRRLEAEVSGLKTEIRTAKTEILEALRAIPEATTQKIERTDGKIANGFNEMKQNFKKLANLFSLDQIFSALAFITSLHNAAMLSSNLVTTLTSIIDTALDIVGIKGIEGESVNVSEILGKKASELAKTVLGAENFTNLTDTWKKTNRFYQASMNIANSIQSMIDSTRSIMELGAENTGKIGNALKKAGVVIGDAYGWMPENINAATSRQIALNRMNNTIRSLDDTASSLESVVSEVKSIQDVQSEIQQQRQEWQRSMDDLKSARSISENTSKLASESAIVTKTDLSKPVE